MASSYPATVDDIDTAFTDDPDIAEAINAIEKYESWKWKAQTIPYAATITPDPSEGAQITVGTLTGGITVANPDVNDEIPGARMVFTFTQDGGGSHAVAWGNHYQVSATAVSGTASKVSTVVVEYNGAKWVQVGGVAAVA